jgi:MarR-like DNA-binding transcriptional regulator SgrR of sgrS sRNA
MRPTRSHWLAASRSIGSSVCVALLLVAAAAAETRPHYGGVLRIETQAAIMSLPEAKGIADSPLGMRISDLIYDGFRACYGRGCSNPLPGPFRVAEFVPGRKLTLVANDDYSSRPFLNGIEITMGRPAREQLVALQLGRADVIDVPAETTRRASQEGVRLVASSPVELVAIVFSANMDPRVREAISLSVDRAAIFNVLLGRQGEPTAALLPAWMTGYGFLFDASQNVTHARQLAVEAGRAKPIALTYDSQDALARAIAERIALDARAAGLNIIPGISAGDAKVIRITLTGVDTESTLRELAHSLGRSSATQADSRDPQELYQTERKLRDELRIVPLLHLPIVYGVAPRVKGWAADRLGRWSLADVWMEQTTQPEPKGQKP